MNFDEINDPGEIAPEQTTIIPDDPEIITDEPGAEPEINDDPPVEPTPATEPPAPVYNEPVVDPVDPADDGSGTGTEDLNGMELYLANFGIEGGMVSFDDETEVHFDELTPTKQAEILTELHNKQTKTVEEAHGLDEAEIGVINYLRESNKSFEDLVNESAATKAEQMLAIQNSESVDFDAMPDDAVYRMLLQKNQGDTVLTEDQITQGIEAAKALPSYASLVNGVRNTFKGEQKIEQDATTLAKKTERDAAIEDDRKEVISAVANIKDIDGVPVNEEMLNTTLDSILEVTDEGDSLFMAEVFSDPAKLVKAAFWYKHGADILSSEKEYWKREKSAAFKRGQAAPGGKRTFGAPDTTTPTHQEGDNDMLSFDDINQ